jgi:phenylacetate-CoA ligase
LIETAQKMGIDFKRDLKVKRGVFGAEPWTDQMRQYIESASGMKAYDIYGLSEIIGPASAANASARTDRTSSRTISSPRSSTQTLQPVPDGTEGELVITTLSKQAMPVIRYRTRDITALEHDPASAAAPAAASGASAVAATTCSSSAA